MPHKRAKQSVRLNERKQRGEDLAPSKDSLNHEPIPKGAARILNAAKIREDFRIKKRQLEDSGDNKQGGKRRKLDDSKNKRREAKATTKLIIKPGESIQHFNRRVEDDMRPLVKSAVQASNAAIRGVLKIEKEERTAKSRKKNSPQKDSETLKPTRKPPPVIAPEVDKHAGKAKEFQTHSSSAPRRLNDIAQAPPEFKRLPRGASASEQGSLGKRDGVLSMAQKQMMEVEREKAITRYREMKARQRRDGIDTTDERVRDGDEA